MKKDRSYKNVFKGSVLVSTLMDHDQNRFASRAHAVKFAQKLLDAGHIESIVGSGELFVTILIVPVEINNCILLGAYFTSM